MWRSREDAGRRGGGQGLHAAGAQSGELVRVDAQGHELRRGERLQLVGAQGADLRGVERAQGAARDAGVQRGDFILNANGRPVKTTKEFREAVAKAGKAVALLVQRGGSQIFIPVRAD